MNKAQANWFILQVIELNLLISIELNLLIIKFKCSVVIGGYLGDLAA
jgi:hypothetical protein